jgi:lysine-specific permease
LVPSTDEHLLNGGGDGDEDIGVSPFTLTFRKIDIEVAAHIMNAVILTVVLSAGNSLLYASSRTLYVLALEGKAPGIFARVNSRGCSRLLIATYIINRCTGLFMFTIQRSNSLFVVSIVVGCIRFHFMDGYCRGTFTIPSSLYSARSFH